MADNTNEFIDLLSKDIAATVGNIHEDELETVSNSFDKTLNDALKNFNSSAFDNDGFIKKMRDLDLDEKKDKDMVRNVLNNIKHDYIDVQSLNHSELLLRRDLFNICSQMPEMRDVVYIVRDAIIECNVSSGEVSRAIAFQNHQDNESLEAQAKEIEVRHDLLMAIKNFIVPQTLMVGEMYIHVVPYAKLFAELEAIKDIKTSFGLGKHIQGFKESVPVSVKNSFKKSINLYNEENMKLLTESVSPITKVDSTDAYKIEKNGLGVSSTVTSDYVSKEGLKTILENIQVCNGSSILLEEMGAEGFKEFILNEYKSTRSKHISTPETHFLENLALRDNNNSTLGKIDEDDINFAKYNNIKGCYVKYLDGLRMVPIRMDRKVIGYYYISTTMDLQINPAQPNGIVDLSFQHYTRDKNLVDNLANMIIKSFDKKMLEKNIKLKNEIAEIIMAHKFSEGRLSFIYIPENEVVRLIINEDEEGKGHSIIEPTLFPARMYLMLTLYNMLYTLNNNLTRIHYLRSSGLNKDYAAQIQRTMRKFQSRRITIDDIYSFSGVLNKVGGMGEMVLPSGRGDYKALETDTIEPMPNPINIEFLEQQRRQAISGTGVPQLLVINAIDEVDFAKTLEMANTRFLSTVSSYKIDFNRGLTKFYRLLMKYSTDLEDDVIQSFSFQFNAVKQQDLNITTEMVQNFNTVVEATASFFYPQDELEDKNGKPSALYRHFRREMAKEYLPQLDFDNLEEIVKRVDVASTDDALKQKVAEVKIEEDEIAQLTANKEQ
jgi:hypothetical protein